MLYYILKLFNVKSNLLSITIRGAMAGFTAFILGIIMGPIFINMLKEIQMLEKTDKSPSEKVREQHKSKKNTPTMGGIVIIFSLLISIIIWARLDNKYVLWAILSIIGFGAVGFLDDYIKAISKEEGLKAKEKFSYQLLVSIALAVVLWNTIKSNPDLTYLYFPFFRELKINLAVLYGAPFLIFATIVIVGCSNAVNLTDGLDGLAIGCTIIVSTAFTAIAYIVGRKDFAQYLGVTYIPGAAELAICCFALTGAGLSFLWYNCFPASVFMGDCGSLMLGGFLGYVAVALRQEMLLFIIGGIFVLEAISVILQVGSYKLRKKRIFLCAPIHHHFRIKGWDETKVTIRFLIIEILLAIFAVLTLKLR